MAKRKRQRTRHTIVDITFNDDGSKTVRRYGPLRPADLTAEELRPWLDLAYHLMMRREAEERAAAEGAAAEAEKEPAKKVKAKRKPAKVDEAELLPLAELAKRLPVVRGSKPPSRATLYRWATVGLKSRNGGRRKLKTQFVGGTICASLADVREFFAGKCAGEAERRSPYTRAELADMKRRAAKATARMKELGYL